MLLLYVRLLCPDFKFRTLYWATLYVADGTAEGLYHVLEEHFDAMEVPIEKIYFYASDGASVVSSNRLGLAGLLRRNNKSLASVHCLAHREALGMKDAVDGSSRDQYGWREGTVLRRFPSTHSLKLPFQCLYPGAFPIGGVAAHGLNFDQYGGGGLTDDHHEIWVLIKKKWRHRDGVSLCLGSGCRGWAGWAGCVGVGRGRRGKRGEREEKRSQLGPLGFGPILGL